MRLDVTPTTIELRTSFQSLSRLSARSAFGGHARRAAMGGSATACGCTRWPRTCGLRPAPASGTGNCPGLQVLAVAELVGTYGR
jgi:hypothetical protein